MLTEKTAEISHKNTVQKIIESRSWSNDFCMEKPTAIYARIK